jgi:serine phosphatase RsbU (regulator of sigma subunit)
VAYAYASAGTPRYVVYVERAIPPNRRVAVESDSAFSDLHFATYIGPDPSPATLATTDQDPAALPLTGDTARATIPFGDTVITLVATASAPLGGTLGRQLPWVFLAAGLVLTALAATWTSQLIRRREAAEQDAGTIQGLYARLDGLYAEQRGIAETLQRALLPRTGPPVPGLETAFRYVAGAQGVDVGGDWYSVARVDETQVAFVVGDVSGRGVSAAALMARLRFTMLAYLLEGHGPDAVLDMCARQIDLAEDGHFATVLIGVVDLPSGVVTVANAGHPPPLLVSAGQAVYAPTIVGPPIGTWPAHYETTSFEMTPGCMLLAYTDGLIERRGESLGVGLERLADAAVRAAGRSTLESTLDGVLELMVQEASEDDIALLALAPRGEGAGSWAAALHETGP